MGTCLFDKDLRDGKRVELACVRAARVALGYRPRGSNDDNAHDRVFVDPHGNEHTVEIKGDRKSRETGNVALEYSCRGKLSGISVCKAEQWWHVVFLDGVWVVSIWRVEKLKMWLRVRWPELKRVRTTRDETTPADVVLLRARTLVEEGDNLIRLEDNPW